MDYTKHKDEELVAFYLAGDGGAFRTLVYRYTDHLYNFTRKLGAGNDASDITQEVFVKVWDNLKKFDTKKSFKTWIFTIARNTTTDYLRKKKHLLFSDWGRNIKDDTEDSNELESILDDAPLPMEVLEKLDDVKELERLLQKLNQAEREVLTLYFQEKMTFAEISEVLNKSVNTVKSTERRAIIKLRELLHQN